MDQERKIVMRLISFMWFKQNCAYMEEDFDFDIINCQSGEGEPKTKKTPYGDLKYYPCCEKDCPVLSICKEVKK